MLISTCIELEANFKAIFDVSEIVSQPKHYNTTHYHLINKTHHLSSYKVMIPDWIEKDGSVILTPFEGWNKSNELSWYKAYNACKNNRVENLEEANLENLLKVITGLTILLHAQFGTTDFNSGECALAITPRQHYHDQFYEGSWVSCIGEYFRIQFPDDRPEDEKYSFDWSQIENEPNPFRKNQYNFAKK